MSEQPLFTWRGAVCDCQSLKSTTKHVLLTIATHMNGRGEGAYPTTKQLEYETGLSERSVCTHIKLAAEAGWLTVKKHGFAGQKWSNHEYAPSVPDGYIRVTYKQTVEGKKTEKALKEIQCKGTEGDSVLNGKALNLTTEGTEPLAEGTEPYDIEALKEVQSSSSSSSSNSSSNSSSEVDTRARVESKKQKSFAQFQDKPDLPGLMEFQRQVNYNGLLSPCGPAKLESTWIAIDGEIHTAQIIKNVNAHLQAGTWKSGSDYKPPINHVLENRLWLHPPVVSNQPGITGSAFDILDEPENVLEGEVISR